MFDATLPVNQLRRWIRPVGSVVEPVDSVRPDPPAGAFREGR
ncbi:hypothetical protein GZL_04329 [Streptomyces sp. 769]|nr:hypothetical protein GZL_04329 [Streptomyces sp. 769]